jgi:hypothetical protein
LVTGAITSEETVWVENVNIQNKINDSGLLWSKSVIKNQIFEKVITFVYAGKNPKLWPKTWKTNKDHFNKIDESLAQNFIRNVKE